MSVRGSSSDVDLETIAALLDGRLKGEDRARAMEVVARDEAAFEILVQTVKVGEELAESGPAEAVKGPRSWWQDYKVVLPLAAAAGLLLAIVLVRPQQSTEQLHAANLAASLAEAPTLQGQLVDDWFEQPWTVTRGLSSRLGAGEKAFRTGVQSLDLNLALLAGQTDQSAALAARVANQLEDVGTNPALPTAYRSIADSLRQGAAPENLARRCAELDLETARYGQLESVEYELGKWTEAGRLATLSDNAALLNTAWFRSYAQRIARNAPRAEIASDLTLLADLLRDGARSDELGQIEAAFSRVIGKS